MTKILVIEDDQPVRKMIVKMLKRQDFAVIEAENGAIGVQMALSEVPDLILCDVQMPELDGHQVLRTLRQNSLMATIPFIFLTARAEKADFRAGMELGADDYVTKPFTQAELLGAIAARLQKQAAVTQPFTLALHQVEERLNELANSGTGTSGVSPERLALEALLRHALANGEFQVYYQPQADLTTGQIVGAEALVRWYNPERGHISPAEFIPVAEETGTIVQIGEWVLLCACAQASKLLAAGFSEFHVSVNLSAGQFADPDLSDRIIQILQTTALPPANLVLEITETSLIQDTAAAIATLKELKALGVRVAIDDFGTGYASLMYLKQFPLDTLKIDKGFVSNVTRDAQNKAIASSVIQLARKLNLKVVAEGVETEAELAFLKRYKCDIIQGYLFSRPVPAAELESMLAENKCLSFPDLEENGAAVIPFSAQARTEKSEPVDLSGFGPHAQAEACP